MSRKNKFRAWSVDEKEMIPADALAFDTYAPLCELLKDTEHIKYMQYTGLEDKNGKEIYEGDIVIVDCGSIDIEDGNFLVEWDCEAARFAMNGRGLTVDFDNVYGIDIEVIGNIYENPELAEEDE